MCLVEIQRPLKMTVSVCLMQAGTTAATQERADGNPLPAAPQVGLPENRAESISSTLRRASRFLDQACEGVFLPREGQLSFLCCVSPLPTRPHPV